MRLSQISPIRPGKGDTAKLAFTLVEVALCLAIIGFAIVAIIGVMPLGMTVQKDNRSDTIINQDGMYWLNAIRTGATGAVDTASFVHWVESEQGTRLSNTTQNPLRTDLLIGILSTPTITNGHRARVRAISSSAAERETEIGFDYLLYAQVQPFTNTVSANAAVYSNLTANMYELRLILRYPAMPDDSPGSGKKVFRSLVTGRPEEFAPRLHRFNSQILEVAP